MTSSLIVFVIVGSTGSSAEDSPNQASRDIVYFSIRPNAQSNKEERIKFLTLLEAYCRAFLDGLPTNTPREEAWIDAEAKTTDEKKIIRLANSPEWSRRNLKEYFSNCSEKTRDVISSMKRPIRDQFSKNSEISYLANVAIELNDTKIIEEYALNAGMNPKVYGLNFLHAIRRSLLITVMRTAEAKD